MEALYRTVDDPVNISHFEHIVHLIDMVDVGPIAIAILIDKANAVSGTVCFSLLNKL